MLAIAPLKRSLEFDPVEQGVKRKRAEVRLPTVVPSTTTTRFTSPPKSTTTCKPSTSVTDDTPIFTHAQAAQRCAQLLREQDRTLREQYEKLLVTKLNEQYEQFIHYSHDNIHKNSSKQKLFHFGQQAKQQESDESSIDFSYVS